MALPACGRLDVHNHRTPLPHHPNPIHTPLSDHPFVSSDGRRCSFPCRRYESRPMDLRHKPITSVSYNSSQIQRLLSYSSSICTRPPSTFTDRPSAAGTSTAAAGTSAAAAWTSAAARVGTSAAVPVAWTSDAAGAVTSAASPAPSAPAPPASAPFQAPTNAVSTWTSTLLLRFCRFDLSLAVRVF